MESAIMKQFNEDIDKLYAALYNEKKMREKSEEGLQEYLKDIVLNLKGEIDKERNEREGTEETLLGLLEATCTKLNAASNL